MWSTFAQALLCTQFGIPEDEDPEGSLSKLRQTTTVRDYPAKFERLANSSQIIPKAFPIRCFIS